MTIHEALSNLGYRLYKPHCSQAMKAYRIGKSRTSELVVYQNNPSYAYYKAHDRMLDAVGILKEIGGIKTPFSKPKQPSFSSSFDSKESSLSNLEQAIISPKFLEMQQLYSRLLSAPLLPDNYLSQRGLCLSFLAKYSSFAVDRDQVVFKQHIALEGSKKLKLCGFTRKRKNFKENTPFLKGSTLLSPLTKEKRYLAICESAIDGLSFFHLKGRAGHILATNGVPSRLQLKSLEKIASFFPHVFLAFDNDQGGHRLAIQVKKLVPKAILALPKEKDWNEELHTAS